MASLPLSLSFLEARVSYILHTAAAYIYVARVMDFAGAEGLYERGSQRWRERRAERLWLARPRAGIAARFSSLRAERERERGGGGSWGASFRNFRWPRERTTNPSNYQMCLLVPICVCHAYARARPLSVIKPAYGARYGSKSVLVWVYVSVHISIYITQPEL